MTITFFPHPADFRRWLAAHHETEKELLVGFYKTGSGKPSITWPQSVDEALCFGWIDGIRRSIDEESYSIRFTPRKAKSKWSTVNIKRMRELLAEGRVRPPGRAAFDVRVKSHYSFESRPREFPPPFLKALQARPRAWRFFEAQPPWYRRTTAFWVMSAKKPETRDRRLAVLIADSEAGRAVGPLRRPK